MAKKTKKSSRRAGNDTAASGSAAACTDNELFAAAVVMGAAEGLSRTVDYVHFDMNCAVNVFPVAMQSVPANERVTGEASAESGWTYSRRRLTRKDFSDKPYLRVFGRVMEILLNHRRRQTCTAGHVFRVFLVEIPGQLEENHRQTPPPGRQVDVTEPIGRRTFNNRMRKMCDEELARPTITRDSGREEHYVLTEDGQNMFNGWPDLADIPGLAYERPVTPVEQPRRRS